MGTSQSNEEPTGNRRSKSTEQEFKEEDDIGNILKSDIAISVMKESDRDERKKNMKLLRRLFTKLDPEITVPNRKNIRKCGCLDLAFKKKDELLMVKVINATDIDPMDMRSVSADAYVKLYFVYDGIQEIQYQQTKVVYNSLNPTFNEIFSFNIEDLTKDYKLKIEVWDYDMLTHDDFLGEIDFNVNSIETMEQNTYYLHDKIDISISGSIKVKVEHQLPCKLSVLVKSACDIGKNGDHSPSTFIAIEIPDSETGLQQTEVIHHEENPEWNQKFVFNVSREEFNLRTVFFNVIEYSRMGRNHSLGGAILPLKLLNSEDQIEKTIVLKDTKTLNAENINRKILTQEYREALIAHAQIKIPSFIFNHATEEHDMMLKLACNKSSTISRIKIRNGCPIY